MKIIIVGTGYVGLVTGACFADIGVQVICVDKNLDKIERLKKGEIPIYEPGLEELVRKNMAASRLSFDTDLAANLSSADVVFSAVGTPPNEEGEADLSAVMAVAQEVASHLDHYIVFVTKSTVPIGTGYQIKALIEGILKERGKQVEFDIVANPEFLKEGNAVMDFIRPDRVVVGYETERARTVMDSLYKHFMLATDRMIYTDIPSAEMIKYASNAMLATRISFMNDIANLCEKVGANVHMVRKGMGADGRIGSKFLYPGCGYGGSCFPKDIKALIATAKQVGCSLEVLEAVERVNQKQKEVLFEKFITQQTPIQGRRVAIWGLSFKPKTDDIREAPALNTINKLLQAGCKLAVYDPVAIPAVKRLYGEALYYAEDQYSVLDKAEALFIFTEWRQFRCPDWSRIRSLMQTPQIYDGRNIYDQATMKQNGFNYHAIGLHELV